MSASEIELAAIFREDFDFSSDAYVKLEIPTCDDSYEDEDSSREKAKVDVMFYDRLNLIYWYSMTPCKFTPIPANTNNSTRKVSFKPPGDHDLLLYTYLKLENPNLWVKDKYLNKYQIAWTNYFGYNVSPSARITVNNQEELSRINKYYCAFDLQYQSKSGHQKSYASRAGRVKELIEWSTNLKSKKLTPRQPWWYGMRPWAAFPLYKIDSQQVPIHEYTFDINIFSHLRMRRFKDGKWTQIKPKKKVVEGLPTDNLISVPELYGMFAKITDNEKTFVHIESKYFIDSVVDVGGISALRSVEHSETQTAIIETGDLVTKVIHWGTENISASSMNNHFNFTSDSNDMKHGEAPIEHHSLMYGTTSKFEELGSEHLEGPLTDEHFDSAPLEKGYFAFSFPYVASRPGQNVGIRPDYTKTKLAFTMKDESEIGNAKYKPVVCARVTKRIKIENRKVIIIDTGGTIINGKKYTGKW